MSDLNNVIIKRIKELKDKQVEVTIDGSIKISLKGKFRKVYSVIELLYQNRQIELESSTNLTIIQDDRMLSPEEIIETEEFINICKWFEAQFLPFKHSLSREHSLSVQGSLILWRVLIQNLNDILKYAERLYEITKPVTFNWVATPQRDLYESISRKIADTLAKHELFMPLVEVSSDIGLNSISPSYPEDFELIKIGLRTHLTDGSVFLVRAYQYLQLHPEELRSFYNDAFLNGFGCVARINAQLAKWVLAHPIVSTKIIDVGTGVYDKVVTYFVELYRNLCIKKVIKVNSRIKFLSAAEIAETADYIKLFTFENFIAWYFKIINNDSIKIVGPSNIRDSKYHNLKLLRELLIDTLAIFD